MRHLSSLILVLTLGPLLACGTEPGGANPEGVGEGEGASGAEAPVKDASPAGAALRETLQRSLALADSMEDLLRPVPLQRPAEERGLKQFSNAATVARARQLGIRPETEAELESLIEQGRLVQLGDSTEYWVLRDLRASRAVVTPDMHALLERLGQRFQARLEEMGLPPLRFEISSVLRTPAEQAALRRRNPNAAAGTSAHEFATTVDIPYSGYGAPAALPIELSEDAPETLRPELERVAREVIERMAARKSRELKKILGDTLRELQSQGDVLVTLEELQPVYHITVAREQAGD